MREREAQLELVRKRGILTDTISICSSNGENVTADQSKPANNNNAYEAGKPPTGNTTTTTSAATAATTTPSGTATATTATGHGTGAISRTSTFERQPKKVETKMSISSKLEIFEQRSHGGTIDATDNAQQRSSLKDSVRKINSTIDSYLKDKRDYENMYEFVKMSNDSGTSAKTTSVSVTPPVPPTRSSNLDLSTMAGQRLNQTSRRNNNNNSNNIYSDTASIASYTRSEYGPVRNYGLHNSLGRWK